MTPLQFVNNKTYVQQLDCLFLYYIDDQKLHHDETKLMSYDIGRIKKNIYQQNEKKVCAKPIHT